MSEAAKWYVVHTYSGYENKVKDTIDKVVENRNLRSLIPQVCIPTEHVKEITEANKEREVDRKIFPGYVLVKMILTDDSWYVVRNVRGVTGFVGPGSKPVPLTEEEVLTQRKQSLRSTSRRATRSRSIPVTWKESSEKSRALIPKI